MKAAGLPLTVNVVLHRDNLDRVPAIIALAERLGADRLELANTQYLGWALPNRDALLPTREQLDRAFVVASAARERLMGRMEIDLRHARLLRDVAARLHGGLGAALRPHRAGRHWCSRATPPQTLPGLVFESVRDRPLAEVWRDAPGLDRFRGDGWMAEPCASCPRKAIDHGGCRCQAYQLTGDAAATDPACSLSPAHGLIEAARLTAAAPPERGEPRYLYRTAPRITGMGTER